MSVAALVIRPASDTSTVGFGSPRFVWLKALKFSHRNSRVFPSRMTKFLDSERLNRYCGGPRSEPLEAVPLRKGCCGEVYAAGSSHKSRLGFGTWGCPLMSRRELLKSALSSGALQTKGVRAAPDSNVRTRL